MEGWVTYSKSITIPLSRACLYYCLYCAFREDGVGLIPGGELDRLIYRARMDGYSEALLMSGERPEGRDEVREELKALGFKDFIDFALALSFRLLKEGLLPHTNIGCLNYEELERLKEANASMGLMLENINAEFGKRVHPQKDISARLKTIESAGMLKIPFTTGILIGLGESQEDRINSLKAIAETHKRYGHIQEIIIQPYTPNSRSRLIPHPPAFEELIELVVTSRRIMPDVVVQIPPNLTPRWLELIPYGAGDLGGISKEGDLINPENPWEGEEDYARLLMERGYRLKRRLPIYKRFYKMGWYSKAVKPTLESWVHKAEFEYYKE